jgi:hypothetical protein
MVIHGKDRTAFDIVMGLVKVCQVSAVDVVRGIEEHVFVIAAGFVLLKEFRLVASHKNVDLMLALCTGRQGGKKEKNAENGFFHSLISKIFSKLRYYYYLCKLSRDGSYTHLLY